MSEPHTPTARTRTCASPGPGSVVSISESRNCRGPISSATRMRLLRSFFGIGFGIGRLLHRELGHVIEHAVEIRHVAVKLRKIVAHFGGSGRQVAKRKTLRLHPWHVAPSGC